MGVLRFITMSYKTKSEQSECKIHDPMIYACGCGERDIPFFVRTPPRDHWNPNPQILKNEI